MYWTVFASGIHIGTRAHMVKLEDSKAAPKKVFYQYMVKKFKKAAQAAQLWAAS